jgi:superfamily II DNA helicase RecQ
VDCTTALKRIFGYPHFRQHQREVIDTLMDGRDAFVLMPTGSGKSICYQIPSMLQRRRRHGVSPLIALMQDQVAALRQNGARADFLNSSLPAAEAAAVFERRVSAGDLDLLYVAPERLLSEQLPPAARDGSTPPCSPSTRPTAFPSGGMTSGPSTCRSGRLPTGSPGCPGLP